MNFHCLKYLKKGLITRILTSLLFIFLYTSPVMASSKAGYSINVKVAGIKDTVCYLGNYYGDKQYLKDSARVDASGRFTFKGEETLDGGIYLVILPDKKYFEIIVDKEQFFSIETSETDYVKHMKVKGSEENLFFYEYLNYINPKGKEADNLNKLLGTIENNEDSTKLIREQMQKIDKEVVGYKTSFIAKHPGTFVAAIFNAMTEVEIPEAPVLENGRIDSTFKFRYYKEHYWDNINFSDDRLLRTPIYHSKLKKYMENLTMQIPDSINKEASFVIEKAKSSPELFKYTVWFITNTYERSNIMGMDAVFVYLAEEYYMTNQAYWIDSLQLAKITNRAKQLKWILIGKKAPNLIMKDINEKSYNLHNVAAKYTILYFWDPDCGHCQKITPALKDVYNKYKSQGVEAFAVCTEKDTAKWKKFVDEKELNWINVWDPYQLTSYKKIYDIYSTPVIYLLDEKKEIVAKRISVEQVEEYFERRLVNKDVNKKE